MNPYIEMKERHIKEIIDLPMFFAFNDEQFKRGMEKLGLKETDTHLVYRYPGTGGYHRCADSDKLRDMSNRHWKEMSDALQDEDFAEQALTYELENHEYNITGDVTDALFAIGLDEETVSNDPVLAWALERAMSRQGDPF